MKKLIAVLLCFAALLGAVCVTASATETEEEIVMTKEDALEKTARKSYYRSLYQSGKSSLHGFCGLMTSGQLYALDINTVRVINDGNNQFDYYAGMEVTTGGYYVKPYYQDEYSMEEALNHISRNGTKDVYNIMVCFQWTRTEAGRKYGHAVFINGIIDGMVYFVESYDMSLDRLYLEGSVITCSISEFVDYYARWAVYEGIIWFGNGEYADICQKYGADLTVQTRFDTTLRSAPCVVGQNDCVAVCDISAGVQLRITGIFENPYGDRFYRVDDGEFTGYIAEAAAFVARVNPDDLAAQDLKIPQKIVRGGAVKFAGSVVSANTRLQRVEITVSDMQGRVLLAAEQDCDDISLALDKLSLRLDTQHLAEGAYVVQIYGESAHYVPAGQELRQETARVRLAAQMLLVGNVEHEGEIAPVMNKILIAKKAG